MVFDHTLKLQNTFIIQPLIRKKTQSCDDPQGQLHEALRLAQAIDLNILGQEVLTLREIRSSTLFGQGQVSMIKSWISEKDIQLLIINSSLSPVQQRNLEKTLNCKVIDRTALILEIFGARARTAEGRLQVELASLTYQKSRLVRSWTHLERQRGGLGFIGGPGETQLEIDKRLISHRIFKIKTELETVKRTRLLHRQSRKRIPYPIVALVGYTNAGKSTLFNHLTQSEVFAADLLFATLDPTMRIVKLPDNQEIILSDTVGFISDLPTELIAAFRATLEEVLEADLIIHVRDIAHPNTMTQKNDVLKILKNLGIEDKLQTNMIEVLNKIDLIPAYHFKDDSQSISLSALTHQGMSMLLKRINLFLKSSHCIQDINISAAQGEHLSWFYQHGEVLKRTEHEERIYLSVRLSPENWQKYQKVKKTLH